MSNRTLGLSCLFAGAAIVASFLPPSAQACSDFFLDVARTNRQLREAPWKNAPMHRAADGTEIQLDYKHLATFVPGHSSTLSAADIWINLKHPSLAKGNKVGGKIFTYRKDYNQKYWRETRNVEFKPMSDGHFAASIPNTLLLSAGNYRGGSVFVHELRVEVPGAEPIQFELQFSMVQ